MVALEETGSGVETVRFRDSVVRIGLSCGIVM